MKYSIFPLILFSRFHFLIAPRTEGLTGDYIPEYKMHGNFKLLNIETCGQAIERDDPYYANSRIYNGQEVEPFEYPWMALFYKTESDLLSGEPACSGTVITQRVVVTSARCCTRIAVPKVGYDRPAIPGRPHKKSFIQVGVLNSQIRNVNCKIPLANASDHEKYCNKFPKNYEILGINPHNDYDSYESKDDICLVYTVEPLESWTPQLSPICLPIFQRLYNNTYYNKQLRSAGWGAKEEKDYLSPKSTNMMQRGFLRVMDPRVCVSYFPWVKKKHICAGGRIPVFDGEASIINRPCKGDTGNPLMSRHKFVDYQDSNFVHYLMGVDSTGFDLTCNRPWPEVFTNVQFYVDWILYNLDIDDIKRSVERGG